MRNYQLAAKLLNDNYGNLYQAIANEYGVCIFVKRSCSLPRVLVFIESAACLKGISIKWTSIDADGVIIGR